MFVPAKPAPLAPRTAPARSTGLAGSALPLRADAAPLRGLHAPQTPCRPCPAPTLHASGPHHARRRPLVHPPAAGGPHRDHRHFHRHRRSRGGVVHQPGEMGGSIESLLSSAQDIFKDRVGADAAKDLGHEGDGAGANGGSGEARDVHHLSDNPHKHLQSTAASLSASVDSDEPSPSVGRAVYEVLRIDGAGNTQRLYVRRRDVLRANGLQPRDLRRIDPSMSITKTSPSLTPKGKVLLINVGGVRIITSAEKALLFEPTSTSSRRFLELVLPKLRSADRQRGSRNQGGSKRGNSSGSSVDSQTPPFELEIVEAALMVATGKLDTMLLNATKRVQDVLQKLPIDTNPMNLEELRKVKAQLVELESRSDTVSTLLEEVLDDEDELREFNLTSRPSREEKRRNRELVRLEREMHGERWRREEGPWGGGEYGGVAGGNGPCRGGDPEHLIEEAIEELEDQEEAEKELEEVEDLFEYYLQRCASTQSEAERLLAGARDLEESIGVSLSARRLAVIRLELMLSIGSFAAAMGAVISGIFGMNLRSTFENSVVGFWGVTAAIVAWCCFVCYALWNFARSRRIL
ncbi:unnamed protein product [Pedinophyceae sp. YPF-701]|nr:unnamed protein product [Pedinophyceae sp. YPF-701]